MFRSLEALVAAGAARRMELDGHVYGYVSCRSGHHHHLACRRCGRVDEIGETYVAPVARRIERDRGFRIDDARLDFYGLCAECAERLARADGDPLRPVAAGIVAPRVRVAIGVRLAPGPRVGEHVLERGVQRVPAELATSSA